MYTFGFHYDGPLAKTALIKRNKKKIEIEALHSGPVDVKPFYKVVSGLDSKHLFVRQLNVKLKSKRAILAALPFQVESLLPYPLDQTVLLPFFHSKEKDSTDVALFATTQENVERHLQTLATDGIIPDQLSTTAAAIRRTAEFFFPGQKSFFFLHFGVEESFYGACIDGKVTIAQPFKITAKQAGDNFNKEQLSRELARIFSFLSAKHDTRDFLLTGESRELLRPLIEEEFSVMTSEAFDAARSHAIPVGLALEGMIEDGTSLQFLQGDLIPQIHAKKKIKQRLFYLGACALLSLFLFSAEFFLHKQKESSLAKELDSMQATDALSLPQKIDAIEKRLANKKPSFPYFPTVPKVSDVLAWLSVHPQLSSKDPNEKIDIKSFNYILTKYPKLGENKDGYQAKVDIEFISASPRLARAFHESLISGDPMVNSKSEISWNAHQNLYHTSFYLK